MSTPSDRDPRRQPPSGRPPERSPGGPPPGPPPQQPYPPPGPPPQQPYPPPRYQQPPPYQQHQYQHPQQYQGQPPYPPGQYGYGQQPHQGPPGTGAPSALSPNIAAMLSYLLFGWIGGLIMYFTQQDREVRFHAAQSILTFGGLTIVSFVLNILTAATGSNLLSLLGLAVGLGSFVLWIFLSIRGYQLQHVKLPIVGETAERWAAR